MPSSRSILFAGVVAAVLLAVGYAYMRLSDDQFSYTPPAVEPAGRSVVGNALLDVDPFDVLITYTDDGFVPRDTTIQKGQRVRFLNESGSTSWPAVGVHPTHSLYPEKNNADCLGSAFDACQDLQKGEFFDFTFYYIGTWPYHDHLRAYNTGSITVIASDPATR